MRVFFLRRAPPRLLSSFLPGDSEPLKQVDLYPKPTPCTFLCFRGEFPGDWVSPDRGNPFQASIYSRQFFVFTKPIQRSNSFGIFPIPCTLICFRPKFDVKRVAPVGTPWPGHDTSLSSPPRRVGYPIRCVCKPCQSPNPHKPYDLYNYRDRQGNPHFNDSPIRFQSSSKKTNILRVIPPGTFPLYISSFVIGNSSFICREVDLIL